MINDNIEYRWSSAAMDQVYCFVDELAIAISLCAAMSMNLFDGRLKFYYIIANNKCEIKCKSWTNSVCFDLARTYAKGYCDSKRGDLT